MNTKDNFTEAAQRATSQLSDKWDNTLTKEQNTAIPRAVHRYYEHLDVPSHQSVWRPCAS